MFVCMSVHKETVHFSRSLISFARGRAGSAVHVHCVETALAGAVAVRSHISTIARLNFTKFSAHVNCERGSVRL